MISKEELIELYINQKLKQKEIAEKFGVSVSTIRNKLKKHNISKETTFTDIEKEILLYNPQAKLIAYTKSTEPCEIICSCGKPFKRNIGVIRKYKTCICHDCSCWKGATNGLSKEFVVSFIQKHNCELLSEYIDIKKKLTIRCSCGETFDQSFEVFRKGDHHGCTACFYIKNHNEQRHTNEEVKNIIENSGCKWLSGDYKNLKSILGISCFQCEEEFSISLDKFVYQHKIRCNKCSSNRSTYEVYLHKLLTDLNIEFLMDKHLEGAYGVKGGRLRFDFIILENGKPAKVIEVDGMQHEKVGGNKEYFNSKQSFNERIKNDKLKELYCLNHNIPLLRISYKMFRSKKKKELLENEMKEFIYSEEEMRIVS